MVVGTEHALPPTIAARHGSAAAVLADYARQMVTDAEPPTCQDLSEWLPACPDAAMSETISRLSDTLGQAVLRLAVTTAGDLIIETAGGESTIPISDLADRHGPDAHAFSLAPLIWAWLRRYATPEHRRDQIAPESLRHARVTQASLPMAPGDGLPRLGRQEGHQASLPGMEPPTATVVPALPLPVAMEHTAGPGGHIASRLWFGFQMALPLDLRTSSDVRMKFTLRDIRDWLWPHGWRRGVHLPMLQKGLRDLYQLGIVYNRAEWLLVRPVTLPTGDTRLDDILLVDVTALPGSDRGPMVDTVRLWQMGVQSAVGVESVDQAGLPVGRREAAQRRPPHPRGPSRGPAGAGRGHPRRPGPAGADEGWAASEKLERPPRHSNRAAGTALAGRPRAGPGHR